MKCTPGIELNKVAFWNCGEKGGESHIGKGRTLGKVVANENISMICVTDTRIDDFTNNWINMCGNEETYG